MRTQAKPTLFDPNVIQTDPKLLQQFGELTKIIRRQAIESFGPDPVRIAGAIADMNQLREHLLEEGDSALEKMVVEQIVTNYIVTGMTNYQLEHLDAQKAYVNEAKLMERRNIAAHRRLNRSVRLLTNLRLCLAKSKTGFKAKLI